MDAPQRFNVMREWIAVTVTSIHPVVCFDGLIQFKGVMPTRT
jgi:hypothetical protein